MFSKKNVVYYYCFLVGIVFLAILFIFETTITQIFADSNLLPKKEKFTELYFNDHQSLPTRVLQRKEYPFSFTVHNLEQKSVEYPYEVYTQTKDNKKDILSTGKFTLDHNKYKTVYETLNMASVAGRMKVVVNLKNKKQVIDFWIYE